MPKRDFVFKPGDQVPEILKAVLGAYFKPVEIEKLFRHGGLVRLSVAAPYSPTQGPRSKKRELDAEILAKIEEVKDSPVKLDEYLSSFTGRSLLELCKKIGLPISKSASSREVKTQLMATFQAGQVWNKIAGNTPSQS
jgi:hypothetical protein